MNFEDLYSFVEKENKRLKSAYGPLDERTHTFGRAIKLTEEVGELNEALLSSFGLQRDEKLSRFSEEELEHEFADVMLCVLLLAESMDVDIAKALEEKIKKINKRKY